MAVSVTCDRCERELPEHHYELFEYTADEDGEDIEHSYDFCSFDCLTAQVEIWRLERMMQ